MFIPFLKALSAKFTRHPEPVRLVCFAAESLCNRKFSDFRQSRRPDGIAAQSGWKSVVGIGIAIGSRNRVGFRCPLTIAIPIPIPTADRKDLKLKIDPYGLPDLSNFCCLPGRAERSPNRLGSDHFSISESGLNSFCRETHPQPRRGGAEQPWAQAQGSDERFQQP